MSLGDFVRKQFIDVIEWADAPDGVLAYRFPMRDREIQSGAMLTVRESQAAAFVNEGLVADVFGPGVHRLTTRNLPLLTDLKNWDKLFESPFKSDVYFFSTRLQLDQRWGTASPITVRDPEFGTIALRGYGIYAYHLVDPRVFFKKVSGTRDQYAVSDLEGQLRGTIVGRVAETFAQSKLPFVDMAANQTSLGAAIAKGLEPSFADLGLALDSFVVQNLSLPDELQSHFNERMGIALVGDLSKYLQFQTANSMAAAATAPGGTAGAGVGLGAGVAMAQSMLGALKAPVTLETGAGTVAPAAATKFCINCGKSIPGASKFCPECGKPQS